MSERRVLVIEDDADLRALLSITLRRMAGWTVEAVGTGAEGLERARAAPPDLVLLDLTLPDVDGEAVLRELQAGAATRDVAVVVLSAAVRREAADALRALGARAVIAKPLRPAALVAELRALVE